MAGQRSSFGKLQRARDKEAKAAAKRLRRQDGGAREGAAETPPPATDQPPTEDLLERLAEVHREFDAGVISYEQFEEAKADLLSRLPVD